MAGRVKADSLKLKRRCANTAVFKFLQLIIIFKKLTALRESDKALRRSCISKQMKGDVMSSIQWVFLVQGIIAFGLAGCVAFVVLTRKR